MFKGYLLYRTPKSEKQNKEQINHNGIRSQKEEPEEMLLCSFSGTLSTLLDPDP